MSSQTGSKQKEFRRRHASNTSSAQPFTACAHVRASLSASACLSARVIRASVCRHPFPRPRASLVWCLCAPLCHLLQAVMSDWQARKVNKMSVKGTWKILGGVIVLPIMHLWYACSPHTHVCSRSVCMYVCATHMRVYATCSCARMGIVGAAGTFSSPGMKLHTNPYTLQVHVLFLGNVWRFRRAGVVLLRAHGRHARNLCC